MSSQGNLIGSGTGLGDESERRFGILVNSQASHNLIGTNGDGVNDDSGAEYHLRNTRGASRSPTRGPSDNVVAGNLHRHRPPRGRTAVPNGGGGVLIQRWGHGQPHRHRRCLGRQRRRGQPDLRQ